MSITLQFVCEDALSSKAIAWFGAGHFSHVDCVLPDGTLLGARNDVTGGKPVGVQIRPPGYDKFSTLVQIEVPCTEAQAKKYYAFLNAQLGKPYDSEAIYAFVVDRDWREPDSWICSELQSAAGEASGILTPLYLDTDKITPVACALVFSAVGGKVVAQVGKVTSHTP